MKTLSNAEKMLSATIREENIRMIRKCCQRIRDMIDADHACTPGYERPGSKNRDLASTKRDLQEVLDAEFARELL